MYVDENGLLTSTPPDPAKKSKIKAEDIAISTPTSTEDSKDEDTVNKGIVSFYNDAKGFGFIKDSETKESIFVHVNNVEGEIKEGNLVTYEIGKGPKGPTAMQVKLVK